MREENTEIIYQSITEDVELISEIIKRMSEIKVTRKTGYIEMALFLQSMNTISKMTLQDITQHNKAIIPIIEEHDKLLQRTIEIQSIVIKE